MRHLVVVVVTLEARNVLWWWLSQHSIFPECATDEFLQCLRQQSDRRALGDRKAGFASCEVYLARQQRR